VTFLWISDAFRPCETFDIGFQSCPLRPMDTSVISAPSIVGQIFPAVPVSILPVFLSSLDRFPWKSSFRYSLNPFEAKRFCRSRLRGGSTFIFFATVSSPSEKGAFCGPVAFREFGGLYLYDLKKFGRPVWG